ncbi:16S rRNA (cytosine1402-N4)-methyltransferase [Aminivibrio pyruvatiphilus]|uniref:Ribosomal RNA small subunit methyltransferase H n=1 Tax=Aminivibrio pyruvatiphilus TaxID=1005740 RepID=A0A4R8M2X9_9BACT|nr:16S rRNA (cytosine(1402)-N(4))-methyltransferase RsmH [Aminivibrio pyruvatiphilus]TDY56084.1 16S rRNA (cytosine1402-N4)-methyltransferase [Aminivibrio pyruvatiphilus]
MTEHIPVLLAEILSFLQSRPKVGKVLDCTLGLGGYSEAVLEAFPKVQVWGLDQDDEAIRIATDRLGAFDNRFHPIHGNFAEAAELAGNAAPFDAILFDLGVSNLQITEGYRGFSFQADGPLDMRMNRRSALTAESIVNNWTEKELSDIFWKYGEERYSRQIARGILRYRENTGKIETTGNLVAVIRETLPAPVQRKMGGHPARKIFQALRIAVNDELTALEQGLSGAFELVSPGAAVAVVSYHSLEDRIVKQYFREMQKEGRGIITTKRPLIPSDGEIERNYKARSAKLRLFVVTEPGKEAKKKW